MEPFQVQVVLVCDEKLRFRYVLVVQLVRDGSPHGNNGWGVDSFTYPLATANALSLKVSA